RGRRVDPGSSSQDRRLLARDEAAPGARGRPAGQTAQHRPRRADEWPRPAGDGVDARLPARCRRERPRRPCLLPPAPRDRDPRRPPRRHRQRPLARPVGRRRSSARAPPPSAPPHRRRRTRRAGPARTAGPPNPTARGTLRDIRRDSPRRVVSDTGRWLGQWAAAALLHARSRHALLPTDHDERVQQALRGLRGPVTALPEGLCVTCDATVPDALTLSRTCRDLDVLITALTDKPIRLEEEFLRLTDRSSEAEHGTERPER